MAETFSGEDARLVVQTGNVTTPATPNATKEVAVTGFVINAAQDIYDITELGDSGRTYDRGFKNWNISVTMNWRAGDTASNQFELWEALMEGSFSGTLAHEGRIQINATTDRTTAGSCKTFLRYRYSYICNQYQ